MAFGSFTVCPKKNQYDLQIILTSKDGEPKINETPHAPNNIFKIKEEIIAAIRAALIQKSITEVDVAGVDVAEVDVAYFDLPSLDKTSNELTLKLHCRNMKEGKLDLAITQAIAVLNKRFNIISYQVELKSPQSMR